MEEIQEQKVQQLLEKFMDKEVYVHLETTNGAYASHFDESAYNVGAFIRNAHVRYKQAKIVGNNRIFRVGLKLDIGWIYAEGLAKYEYNEEGQLLMAGHDREGRLMVALQISEHPFKYEE